MLLPRIVTGILPVAVMVLGMGVAYGEDYPHRPIRIVTSEPGGGTEFAARQIAQGLAGPLGQPVIVESREVVKALSQAEVKEKVLNVGSEAVGNSLEQLASLVKADMARLGKVVKDAGLKLD